MGKVSMSSSRNRWQTSTLLAGKSGGVSRSGTTKALETGVERVMCTLECLS